MKRILNLLFVILLSLFTGVVVANTPPEKTFVDAIPTLNPQDQRWDWMDRQIAKDFEHIRIISKATLRSDLSKAPLIRIFKRSSLDRPFSHLRCYEIKNGVLHGINDHVADLLNAVIARYPVPDLVFLYYHQDLVRGDFFETHDFCTPILCSAKAPDTDGKIIHFIDWYYHISKTEDGWNKMISDIDEKYSHSPWEEKISKLFWRGTTTAKYLDRYINLQDFPRGILVQLSLDHPSLIDARFNRLFYPKYQSHFPQAPSATIPDHLNYKYQLAMDGEIADVCPRRPSP